MAFFKLQNFLRTLLRNSFFYNICFPFSGTSASDTPKSSGAAPKSRILVGRGCAKSRSSNVISTTTTPSKWWSKTAKKSSKQPKNHTENTLNSLSKSETIDKSQTASKKNQRKIIINICQLYSIPSHKKKKSNQKNLLAVIMYNVWNSKIVPIMNVFFSIALYYFSPSTNYPIINYVRRWLHHLLFAPYLMIVLIELKKKLVWTNYDSSLIKKYTLMKINL